MIDDEVAAAGKNMPSRDFSADIKIADSLQRQCELDLESSPTSQATNKP